jgi:hypothetical protein
MSTEFINDQWRLPNAWNGSESNVNKQSNYSMDFDGTQNIDCGDDSSLTPTNGISISFWIKTTDTTQNTGLIDKYNGSTGDGYAVDIKDTYLRFIIGIQELHSTTSISDGIWHNVVFTCDNTNGYIYVDGSQVKTGSLTLSRISVVHNLFLMGDGVSTYKTTGQIDGVAIFNYALSASQITTLYGSSSTGIGNPMSLSPKPVAYYPLGDQDSFNGSNYLVPNSSLKDYVFNFDADYIDCGNDNSLQFQPTDALTFSCWFNADSHSSNSIIVSNNEWTGAYRGYNLQLDSTGVLKFTITSSYTPSNNYIQISSTTTINTGSWYHVVITKDTSIANTGLNMYINGSPASVTRASSGTLSTFTYVSNFNLGGVNNGSQLFDGKISNAQVFNTELSSSDAETLYNNGSPLTSMSGYSSLQGWWKLDASDTYDGTNWTIADNSSNSNTGTSSGMTQANLVQSDLSFKTSYSPFALDFDGANDRIISVSNSGFTSNDARTFLAWIKSTDSSGVNKTIIQTGPDGTCNGNFELSIHQGKLMFNTWASCGSGYSKSGANVITDGNWHFIAITYDGSNINGYVDGSLAGGDFPVSSVTTSTLNTPYYIGGSATGSYSKEFNGSISNCSIWNAALTSAQVTEIYSEGIPQNLNNHSAVSSLVSWWQLGSNSSFNTNWTVLDEKGSNNGTSSNMTEASIVDGVGSYANGV